MAKFTIVPRTRLLTGKEAWYSKDHNINDVISDLIEIYLDLDEE